ncbi:MAG: hypothetical protein ACTHOJ_15625 [Sphingomonas oligoaromativorans]
MTVAALNSVVTYLEDGATTSFPAPFRYLDPSHLIVTRYLGDGSSVSLALGIDFSATAGPTDAGGTLTLNAAATGTRLEIKRDTPRAQGAEYPTNDRFPSATTETAFDRAMLIAQELTDTSADVVARALLFPEGEQSQTLPVASIRAGTFQAFDAAGQPIPASGTGNDPDLRNDLAQPDGPRLLGFAHDIPAPAGTAAAKLLQFRSPIDEPFGADGNFGEDDTDAIQAATDNAPRGGDLLLPAGSRFLVTSLENRLGTKFTGPGRMMTPAPQGGYSQHEQQTYADQWRSSFNRIALYRLMLRLKLSAMQIAGGGDAMTLTWRHFGNSISATGTTFVTGSITDNVLTVTVQPDPAQTGVVIIPGSLITGTGVALNTRVTAYGDLPNTYVVSVAQTVASGILTVNNGGSYAGTEAEPQALIRRCLSDNGVLNIVNLDIKNLSLGGSNISDAVWSQEVDRVSGSLDVMSWGPFATNIPRDEVGDIDDGCIDYYNRLDATFTAVRNDPFCTRWNCTLMIVGSTNTYDPNNDRTNIFYEKTRKVETAIALKHGLYYFDPYPIEPGNVGWLCNRLYGMDNPFGDGSCVHPLEIPQSMWVTSWMDDAFPPRSLALWDRRGPQSLASNLDNGWTAYPGFLGPEYSRTAGGDVTLQVMLAPGTRTANVRPFFLPAKVRPRGSIVRYAKTDSGANVRVRIEALGDVILPDGCPSGTAYLDFGGITYGTR